MSSQTYQRILLKYSGEAVAGDEDQGIDPKVLHFMSKEIKSIFSFVSIFVVLLIVFRITGKAIMKGMNSMQKGLLDRIFGSFFGGLRGSVIIIMLFLVGETYIMRQTWWKDSYMSDYILTGADHLGSFIGRVPYEEINAEDLEIDKNPFN